MEQMMIPEQDIANAICILLARRHQLEPEQIEVELMYDDKNGYFAEAEFKETIEVLPTYFVIEALRTWLKEILEIDPFSAGIQLQIDDEEGMIARIH